VQASVLALQEATKGNRAFLVNFCLSYGGRGELVNAIKQLASQARHGSVEVEKINEQMVSDALQSKGCPGTAQHRTAPFMPSIML
jgi:undecaprenyl diphosphate synthase